MFLFPALFSLLVCGDIKDGHCYRKSSEVLLFNVSSSSFLLYDERLLLFFCSTTVQPPGGAVVLLLSVHDVRALNLFFIYRQCLLMNDQTVRETNFSVTKTQRHQNVHSSKGPEDVSRQKFVV